MNSNSTSVIDEPLATRDGFGLGLVQAAQVNPAVFALTADLTKSLRMTKFKEKFPDRFVQVGVAEQNLIGTAAGLSLAGKIPFAASFAVFSPARSWDQIRLSVAYSNLNVKIVSSHAGLATGADGASHQSLEDIGLMRVLPNMKVIEPCDAEQARQVVHALAADQGPAYLRLTRPKAPIITQQQKFVLGQAQVLYPDPETESQKRATVNNKQKETNRTSVNYEAVIIACGSMVHQALKAARQLKNENISVQVINMHTIKPLDKQALIEAAKQAKIILTAEDHQINGGLGSAAAEVLLTSQELISPHQFKFSMIGVRDKFGESGRPEELREKYGLSSEKITQTIKNLLD